MIEKINKNDNLVDSRKVYYKYACRGYFLAYLDNNKYFLVDCKKTYRKYS